MTLANKMNYLSNDITPKVLFDHFLYFKSSLFSFADKYQNIIFRQGVTIPSHLAYLCPLCLKHYIVLLKDDLNVNSKFNLDHIPPKSVGGTLELITCEKCNNDAGTLYEHELVTKMNYEASKTGHENALFKASFQTAGLTKNLKSFLSKDNEGQLILDFPTKAKINNPFLKSWLNNTAKTDDWEVKLTIQRPDDKKILKAILKSAYLICFINWGYDFAFSSNGNLIRNVLRDAEEYPIKFISFWFDKSNLPQDVKLPLGLCRIENPVELKTFVVNVPLELNGYSSIASVVIPFTGQGGLKKLEEINNIQKDESTLEVSFKQEIASLPNNILDGYSKSVNFS